jgi:ribosome recycling factor
MRSIRSDLRRDIEKQEGMAGISEDDIKAEVAELDEVVKEYMAKLEEVVAAKERELMSI